MKRDTPKWFVRVQKISELMFRRPLRFCKKFYIDTEYRCILIRHPVVLSRKRSLAAMNGHHVNGTVPQWNAHPLCFRAACTAKCFSLPTTVCFVLQWFLFTVARFTIAIDWFKHTIPFTFSTLFLTQFDCYSVLYPSLPIGRKIK